jgi:hypothetical protein
MGSQSVYIFYDMHIHFMYLAYANQIYLRLPYMFRAFFKSIFTRHSVQIRQWFKSAGYGVSVRARFGLYIKFGTTSLLRNH